MRQHLRLLVRKKIIVFILCGTTADKTEATEEIIMNNVPQEIKHTCQIFFLPGRIIHEKLSFKHRLLLRVPGIFETNLAKKLALTSDRDRVDKRNLDPVLETIERSTPVPAAL
jgi:hypothetical protein